jgi:four helix bundle protein
MSEGNGNESIVLTKAYSFALEVIKVYKMLVDKKEFVISKQLLKAGTSIGANVNEAISAESKRDFVHKLSVALKEARETAYWLRLLKDGLFIENENIKQVNDLCSELIRILSSIILTTKQRYAIK